MTASAVGVTQIASPSGLVARLNANGSIARIEHDTIVLNLFPATELEGGPANLYLRCRPPSPAPSAGVGVAHPVTFTPLLGPESPLRFRADGARLCGYGAWQGLRVSLAFSLGCSTPTWFWHVAIESESEAVVDLVHAQDLALAPYGAVRTNEYYVSQYLDHTPLEHPVRGWVLATRQNLSVEGRTPWLLIGALGRAVSFATDALQLHGLATRAGETPAALIAGDLPGVRRQHEHAMAVLQTEPTAVVPGGRITLGFYGWLEPDHPAATSPSDLVFADRAIALPEALAPAPDDGSADAAAPVRTLFSPPRLLRAQDLSDTQQRALWGGERRHEEWEAGTLHSFFTDTNRHVVLRAKECKVLRPHGHVLRTGAALVPDEASLTTSCWMSGVFNSLLTQGHVSINRFLSTTRSYLGLQREHGQRIFVETGDGWQLLDVPSAWEVTPSACRWIYAHVGGRIEISVEAAVDRHAIELRISVTAGEPVRFLISNHIAVGGDDGNEPGAVRYQQDEGGLSVVAPPESDVGRRFPGAAFRIEPLSDTPIERVGGDELLFEDGRSRAQPFLVLVTGPTRAAALRITATLIEEAPGATAANTLTGDARAFWREATGPLAFAADPASPLADDVARLNEILPWYTHDALIHYLAPRGLEQYSGGGWGTRDVCQGPAELLLALGRFTALRDLLLRVYANQNPDGDWPQWFMFFDRERAIRANDSHGDIVFWPLLALAEYLVASEDGSILDAIVPFFDPRGADRAERATVWVHVERALEIIRGRVIPGTRLAAYGHGDWNDSLQPADPTMRERLCSAWTVTLHYQTLTTLAEGLRGVGRASEASALEAAAREVEAAFAQWLLPDGEIAGFAYFHESGEVEYLLHPRDQATGIRHRLLPMIHAILTGLLSPESARAHVATIRAHLLGADGARLFDRPPAYRGGPQRHFQRAESSSFFGREIGLMYTHAHLRYAQAMARLGDADAFFEALRRATPISIGAVVPSARPRQSNCYFSSSDAAVADRYEALARYSEIRAGAVPLEGGWRVYSSGAGIAVRLLHQHFLGLRRGRSRLGIDPVLPKALDGLRAEVSLGGRTVEVVYRVAERGHGPTSVLLNGVPLPLERERLASPYRSGGVSVPLSALQAAFRADGDQMVVQLA